MKRAAMLLATTLLGACSFSKSNTEEPAALTEFTPAFQLEEVWSTSYGGVDPYRHVRLEPRFVKDTVYVVDDDGDVMAYSIKSGETVWEVDLDLTVTGGLGVGDGRLYLGTEKGEVICLDAANGEVVWRSRVSSEVLAPPVPASGRVIVQTIDGSLYGLASDDGKPLWDYHREEPALSLRGTGTPQVVQDLVFSGFAGGVLVALGINDGRLLWEHAVSYPSGRNEVERLADVDASPLVTGYNLFAVSFQGRLVSVDLRSGKTLWSREVSAYTGLAADTDNIYVTDELGHVHAFDRKSGATVWVQNKLKGRRLGAPAVSGGYVVTGDFEGWVHWLNVRDGAIVARYQVGSDPIRTAPIALDGSLIVNGIGGKLAALRAR